MRPPEIPPETKTSLEDLREQGPENETDRETVSPPLMEKRTEML